MGISAYLKGLREKVGTSLLLVPGVAAIVRDDAGRILMQRRRDDNEWGLPAGAVDPGEAPAQALVREVWEETGLRVVPERVLAVFGGKHSRFHYPNGDRAEYTVVLFECRVVGGKLEARDGESLELRYFEPAQIPVREAPSLLRLYLSSLDKEGVSFQWEDAWLSDLRE